MKHKVWAKGIIVVGNIGAPSSPDWFCEFPEATFLPSREVSGRRLKCAWTFQVWDTPPIIWSRRHQHFVIFVIIKNNDSTYCHLRRLHHYHCHQFQHCHQHHKTMLDSRDKNEIIFIIYTFIAANIIANLHHRYHRSHHNASQSVMSEVGSQPGDVGGEGGGGGATHFRGVWGAFKCGGGAGGG